MIIFSGSSGDQTVTLTGDVTGTGTGSVSTTIADDSVTNAKLANMATQTIKGRTTAGTGDPQDLTATQATAILNNFVGDSGSGGTKGLVPAPASGDAAAAKFLKADGTWVALSDELPTFDFKQSVRVATTANITLSGTQTIDGVAVIAGDRVLAKNQTAQADRGIYVCASGAWSRSSDADVSAEVTSGMFVFVEEGTANAGAGFLLTTANPITLGVTALAFSTWISASNSANKNLSNLNATAVNQDLIPGSDAILNLGDGSHSYNTLFLSSTIASPSTTTLSIVTNNNSAGGADTGQISIKSGTISTGTTGASGAMTFGSGPISVNSTADTGAVNVLSGNTTSTDAGSDTGVVTLGSGNATTGNSGNTIIKTGTAGATRGYIQFSSLVAVLPTGTSDPSTSYPNGSSYYNTSSNTLRVLNGGTWRGILLV